MELIVKQTEKEMSRLGARMIAQVIRANPRAVLGLATGSTPLTSYRELIRMHRKGRLDFDQVVTFNLDEYVGLRGTHKQSYRYFMNRNFFNHINIRKENTHLPDGVTCDLMEACKSYETEIHAYGGIDLQLLGIGSNGHIAFNEPGSSLASRTRIKTLSDKTRGDNSRFFKSLGEVPRYAVTMGIGTIMEARAIVLLAQGASKAAAIAAACEGPVTAMCPASALQLHPAVTIIIDKAAASMLKGTYPAQGHRLIM